MGVDTQLQIYILGGVFGLICIIIIFFLAGICGQLSKIKQQQRKLHFDHNDQLTGYDNYAYNSRTIQPDEELGRRGYRMYDPNNRDSANYAPNVHRNTNSGKQHKTKDSVQQNDASETAICEEQSRDLVSEYSIANTETVVMSGNDLQMRMKPGPPEFLGIPPPPAFRQKNKPLEMEPNSSENRL